MPGLTVIAAVVAPVFQEYVVAPLAVKVDDCCTGKVQIKLCDVTELTVGFVLTPIVITVPFVVRRYW